MLRFSRSAKARRSSFCLGVSRRDSGDCGVVFVVEFVLGCVIPSCKVPCSHDGLKGHAAEVRSGNVAKTAK